MNQFAEKYKENKIFNFEAWKYPERKYLWENLILEMARQINPEKFDETLKVIEGKQHKDKSKLLEVVSDLPYLKAIKNFDYFLETSPATRTFQLQSIFENLLKSIDAEKIYIVVEDVDRA
jgi:ERCC4-type nuclease